MAGLISKTKEENNRVGIGTCKYELEERFVEISLKDFKIDSRKILADDTAIKFRQPCKSACYISHFFLSVHIVA